eukprot:TRINITY_DN13562_c0_g1_i7.p1 TRINITY_DN13562_c0_g1~~TRINITY_DN13562_c0_g1_i7.p1  ORF type:complete len:1006 (-),score=193.74 TRINITY_DN13562_c0_g1_i7:702-3719(-)
MIRMGEASTPWTSLGLSSTLEYISGPTRTLWIGNTSIAINAGTEQTASSTITVDQRGVSRVYNPAQRSTIGAYEKNIARVEFTGAVSSDAANTANWNWQGQPQSFNNADFIYVIGDADVATISSSWTVGAKSTIEISGTGSLTVGAGKTITATEIVHAGSAFFSIMGVVTGNNAAGVSLSVSNSAYLNIGTADANISKLNISLASGSSTTVEYSYTGNQTVRNLANYSNLVISNSGNKTLVANLTLGGNLTVQNSAVFEAGAYTVSAVDLTVANATLSSTGTVNVSGNGTLNSATVNVNVLDLEGNLTMRASTLTATSQADIAGGLIAHGGVTSAVTAPAISFGSINVSGANSRLNLDFVSSNIGTITTAMADAMTVADGAFLSFRTTGNAALNFDNTAANTIQGTLEIHAGTVNPVAQARLNGSLLLDYAITLNSDIANAIQVGKTLTFAGTVALGSDVHVSAGSVVFDHAITGNSRNLEVTTTAGNAVFNTISGVNSLTVTVAGGNILLGGDITAANGVDFTGGTVLQNNVSISAGAGAFSSGVINANNHNLSITAGLLSTVNGNIANANNLTLNAVNMLVTGGVSAVNVVNQGGLNVGTNMTLTGNLTNSGTLLAGGNVNLNGTTRQTVNNSGTMNGNDFISNNAAGVLFTGSDLNAESSNITLNFQQGRLYLDSYSLYEDGQLTFNNPANQWVVTSGSGRYYQKASSGVVDITVGTDNGYVSVSSTGGFADGDWVGARVYDGIYSYNPYGQTANIRGLENAVKATLNIDSGNVAFTPVVTGGTLDGSGFDLAAYSVYQHAGNGWTIVNSVNSGDFIFANSTGVDFRAQGILDFPTEGWMLENDDNSPSTPIPVWERESGVWDFVPVISERGLGIGLGSQRGFSFVGSGGDVSNTIGVIPTTGEDGVNIFGGGSYGGEGFGDADYIEEEEYDVFFEDLGDTELPVANVTRHSSFISSYDSTLDAFLASQGVQHIVQKRGASQLRVFFMGKTGNAPDLFNLSG